MKKIGFVASTLSAFLVAGIPAVYAQEMPQNENQEYTSGNFLQNSLEEQTESVVDFLAIKEPILESMFLHAAQHGDLQALRRYLQREDLNVNATNKQQQTALILAVINGHVDIVRELVAVPKVNVNAKDHVQVYPDLDDVFNQMSAFMYAAHAGNVAIVRELLKRDDLDINAKEDRTGMSALIYAAKEGHADVVQELIKREDLKINDRHHYDSLDIVATYEWSAFYYAANNGHADVVRVLLTRKDLDVNAPALEDGKPEYTPLQTAVRHGHIPVMRELLARKDVNVSVKAPGGYTLLILAAKAYDGQAAKVIRALYEWDTANRPNDNRHLDVNAMTDYPGSRTALMYAAQDNDVDAVRELLRWERLDPTLHPDGLFAPIYLTNNQEIKDMIQAAIDKWNARKGKRAAKMVKRSLQNK